MAVALICLALGACRLLRSLCAPSRRARSPGRVQVEIEDALTPAFIVEELEDDRFVVLVPSVPTPAAGSIYVLPAQRVHWVDAPVTQALSVITRWGAGTGTLIKAMRAEAPLGRSTL